MKRLFTLPTWLVFLLLIFPGFLPSATLFGTILVIIWVAFLGFSIYLLGIGLYQKLPEGHDLKIKRFRFNFIFPVVYLTIILILFRGGYEINQDNYGQYGGWLAVIIPLHLYTMYCMFYVIWFIAKSIATIENNRPVGFDTYAGNFFLLWFFPIGIWFVHPKVRKIFSMDAEARATV